jgi:multidrug efflux pump subunit AcrB
MVRYLIYRPIGTCVVALTLVLLGAISTRLLPVSLLPDIPVPEITVQATYPNADARQIQQIIALPLRNQLIQLNQLDDLEAIIQDGLVVIKLRFDYNTDVGLAYLEANEKIDMLMESLPRDMSRPKVIKAGAGDIAVFQLNVKYKEDNGDFLELSNFSENILKRRLEQLQEIALVDITGLVSAEVLIQPDLESLEAFGLSINEIIQHIQSQSGELGNVTVKDGPYEFSITFDASLRKIRDIENLYFKVNSDVPRLVRLGDISKISIRQNEREGLYTFDGERAIGMAIIKQNTAQLLSLREEMNTLVKKFEKDYPKLEFRISQDQTELLDLSISNLINSLIIGAILSFAMVLFFMKDKLILLLIGLVIPVSISLTLLGFYIFGISINIVSLAGLVLGIGEIVDSAIIIIENIEQYLEDKGDEESMLSEACVKGVNEVIRPLFTSVLTNSLVFLPLLFLSGIAGALFFDQAIAVSLALGTSLFTSFTLIPVMYFHFFKKRIYIEREISYASRMSEILYNKVFHFAIKRPAVMILFWAILLLISVWIIQNIDKNGMPSIARTELEAYINWAEPVSPQESNRRLLKLMKSLKVKPMETGFFIGQQQFLLNTRLQQSNSEAMIVAKVNNKEAFYKLSNDITQNLKYNYPRAIFEVRPALNIFEQLFQTAERPLKILISGRQLQFPPSLSSIDSTCALLKNNGVPVQAPPRRERITLHVQAERLLLYGVELSKLLQSLRMQLNDDKIGLLRLDQQHIPILLGSRITPSSLQDLINKASVLNNKKELIPVKELVRYSKNVDYASLYLGKSGAYVPLIPDMTKMDVPKQRKK